MFSKFFLRHSIFKSLRSNPISITSITTRKMSSWGEEPIFPDDSTPSKDKKPGWGVGRFIGAGLTLVVGAPLVAPTLSRHLPNMYEAIRKFVAVNKYVSTPLGVAVMEDNMSHVEKLINQHVNVNEKDAFGNTALHYAVDNDSDEALKIIQKLLNVGAKIDIPNDKKITAFHRCCEIGNEAMLRMMCFHLDKIESKNPGIISAFFNGPQRQRGLKTKMLHEVYGNNSWISLMGAVWNNNYASARFLIQNVRTPSSEEKLVNSSATYNSATFKKKPRNVFYDAPIYWAIKNMNFDLVRLLVRHGAILDQLHNDGFENDQTLLNLAILSSETSRQQIVDLLLDKFIENKSIQEMINMVGGKHGHTPLHEACSVDDFKLVTTFIEKGANVLRLSIHGRYAFELSKNQEIRYFILKKMAEKLGIDENIYKNTGDEIGNLKNELIKKIFDSYDGENQEYKNIFRLHLAIVFEHFNLAMEIIKEGKFISRESYYGRTILYDIAFSGNVDLLDLFIEKLMPEHEGLENYFTIKSKLGWNPLMIAAWKGHRDMMKKILECNNLLKIDVNDKGDLNDTALLLAIEKRCGAEIVRIFLDRGALFYDSEMQTELDTPLHIAARNGDLEILKVLINDKNFNRNQFCLHTQSGKYERTPLHEAARNYEFYQNMDVINLLLDSGSNPYFLTHHGNRPSDLTKNKELKNRLFVAMGINKSVTPDDDAPSPGNK